MPSLKWLPLQDDPRHLFVSYYQMIFLIELNFLLFLPKTFMKKYVIIVSPPGNINGTPPFQKKCRGENL